MDKNQFLFIAANKMFLMIIDKGRNTIINTNLELKQTDDFSPMIFVQITMVGL